MEIPISQPKQENPTNESKSADPYATPLFTKKQKVDPYATKIKETFVSNDDDNGGDGDNVMTTSTKVTLIILGIIIFGAIIYFWHASTSASLTASNLAALQTAATTTATSNNAPVTFASGINGNALHADIGNMVNLGDLGDFKELQFI